MNAPTTATALKPQRTSLVQKFADRFSIEPNKLLSTLKATAFRQKDAAVTDEQMASLLIVADQYKLNPFTREIFAFPDKGGIVPVVGVDGWSRIINEHPEFDGMDFNYPPDSPDGTQAWCEVVIHRKDRAHPIVVREYFSEVKRSTQPWQSHPRRMLRHKTIIQGARVAFGFAGIYDEDEAERIIAAERDITPAKPELTALPEFSQEDFDASTASWRKAINKGNRTAQEIVDMVNTKYTLSDEQIAAIKALQPTEE